MFWFVTPWRSVGRHQNVGKICCLPLLIFTMKMEAAHSSKKLVHIYQNTWCKILILCAISTSHTKQMNSSNNSLRRQLSLIPDLIKIHRVSLIAVLLTAAVMEWYNQCWLSTQTSCCALVSNKRYSRMFSSFMIETP